MPDPISIRPLAPADIESVRDLWHGAHAAGELPGLDPSYIDRLAERLAVAPEGVYVASGPGGIAGAIDPKARLVVVRPASRRQGIGRRMVVAAESDHAASVRPLLLWLPDGNDGGRRFLEALDYRHHSSLWRLDLPPGRRVPPPSFPADIRQRQFDEIDIDAFVDLFNAAFRDHPTPLAVTREVVEWAHARPGFDPALVLILIEVATDRAIGFCRLAIDEHGPGSGEIDFVALLPDWRGRGLGRELLRWGVHRLRSAGAEELFLQVEGANAGALRLYRQTGFVPRQEWRRWASSNRPPAAV